MDADTVALIITIIVSSLGTVGLLLRQINHLDAKLAGKIDALDAKFDAKIDALDVKFDAKIDVMGGYLADVRERLARMEGHLMAPEGFRMRGPRPSSSGEPAPEDPNSDRRQAG